MFKNNNMNQNAKGKQKEVIREIKNRGAQN